MYVHRDQQNVIVDIISLGGGLVIFKFRNLKPKITVPIHSFNHYFRKAVFMDNLIPDQDTKTQADVEINSPLSEFKEVDTSQELVVGDTYKQKQCMGLEVIVTALNSSSVVYKYKSTGSRHVNACGRFLDKFELVGSKTPTRNNNPLPEFKECISVGCYVAMNKSKAWFIYSKKPLFSLSVECWYGVHPPEFGEIKNINDFIIYAEDSLHQMTPTGLVKVESNSGRLISGKQGKLTAGSGK